VERRTSWRRSPDSDDLYHVGKYIRKFSNFNIFQRIYIDMDIMPAVSFRPQPSTFSLL
jgi:hypothetical protein